MKHNKIIGPFFILLSISVFLLFSCQDNILYYITNHSSKDIKVLFIDKTTNDTLSKFILEPEADYNFFESPHGVLWQRPKDTLSYGMVLIITQDSLLSTKEYWDKNKWDPLKNKRSNLNIRDEDF